MKNKEVIRHLNFTVIANLGLRIKLTVISMCQEKPQANLRELVLIDIAILSLKRQENKLTDSEMYN